MWGVVAFALLGLATAQQGFPSFDEFKQLYPKNYDGLEAEDMRRVIYNKNIASYAEWNAEGAATYGVDQDSDLTTSEWKISHGVQPVRTKPHWYVGGPESPDQCNFGNFSSDVLSSSSLADDDNIDWVAKGAVTPVKNQGSYGTCSYFASISVMEAINKIQGGNDLVSLSEQQVIDCCTPSTGCNGWPGEEIAYFAHHHAAAVTEASYAYTGASTIPKPDGTPCKTGTATPASSSKRICVPIGDPDTMMANLKTLGPATLMLNLDCLQGYRSGVINRNECRESPGTWPDYWGINHATTLVGAGEDNGVKYWKVRNSWGSSFGEKGYYRVIRDKAGEPYPMLGTVGAAFGVYAKPASSPVVV